MHDRAKSGHSSLGVTELLAWGAGLAALAGLVVEVVRRSNREPEAGLIGGLLVLYVVYLAFSVRPFWSLPRVAIPITLLVGGALWTLSFQLIDRSDFTRGLISAIFIPLAMAYSVRLICPDPGEPQDIGDGLAMPSLVHSLLDKGKGLGNRSDRAA
jgi:hypothetical protein